MNKLTIALAAAALTFGTAGAQNLQGPLSGTLGPGTYIVVGSISVMPQDTLILAPGTIFRMNGPYSFSMMGCLQAIGTATDSIKFIRNTGVSGWEGMDFLNAGCSASVLEYCLINGSQCQGISCQNGASPTIRHSTISQNAAGAG
jgi:hypothetical protein